MSIEVDYLPVAAASGANVESQADFAGSGHQLNGFSSGEALSAQLNKCWRQPTMMAAAMAWFISNTLNISVLDDGNLSSLITNLTEAIEAAAGVVASPAVISVTYSATPTFNASLGNPLIPVFELVLAGNVTSSTFSGVQAGQIIVMVIVQPSGGGDTFVPPTGLPMATISPTGNSKSTQAFLALSPTLFVPFTPMTID